jgi:dienelactone hydrolase
MSILLDNPAITPETLEELVRRILAAGSPSRILLFGSQAPREARAMTGKLWRFAKARPFFRVAAAALGALVLVAGSGLILTAGAQDIVVTEMRIPTRESGKKGLAAVMVRPNDSRPHPLALMTHGTPREPADRAHMTPLELVPQAEEFARRGWTAVIVMRRGFGDSAGIYAEDSHGCSPRVDYTGPTKQAVIDLRAAAAFLATQPEVDASRMIAIGRSTGGLAMVGLTANPPPGLMAAISFAGGRGSDSPNHVCNPDVLIDTFGGFGKHSRVPMLWVYAANDHYFGPDLAQAFYRAFTHAGGTANFILTGPFGSDGHGLFSVRGKPVWTPIVDDFLKSQNLVLRETLLPIPRPSVEPPPGLSEGARDAFERYLLNAPHKAFAVSQTGHFASSTGRRTTEDAEKQALERCKKFAPKHDLCSVIMLDDQKVEN